MSDCSWSESPRKKRKRKLKEVPERICIIHVRDTAESISSFSAKSWNTAFSASTRRQDKLLNSFTEENIPDQNKYGYHRKCYQSYTNNKQLNIIQTKRESTSPSTDLPCSLSLRRSSREPVEAATSLAPMLCIICQRNKTSTNGSGYEELVKCITGSTAKAIFNSCLNGNDYQQAQVAGIEPLDIIAKEFHFHRSCYRNITRLSKSSNEEHKKREQCFEEIISFVENAVIGDGDVVRLSSITKMYRDLQNGQEITVQGDANRLIKSRLSNRFGDKIDFFKKTEAVELVFSTSDTAPNSKKVDDIISRVASILKKEIFAFEQFSSWPPPVEEIKGDRVELPASLNRFLKELLTNEKETKRINRLVNSLGQDIVFCCSNGRIKTVKHLQLGIFTKRKTGSKQMIECLNKLGHSISYYEVNRFETSLAEQESRHASLTSFTPSNVQPSTFISFVYDNCDHNAETISGQVMHCTNGILIQRKSNHILEVKTNTDRITDNRRRSFKPVLHEIQTYRVSREKVNPATVSGDLQLDNFGITTLISQMSDLIWIISRIRCVEDLKDQLVPSWTGFNNEISIEENNQLHDIHYLPTIDQSPTKVETVHEILLQVKAKSENLGLRYADLVLDHAIYCKALEVLSNPEKADLKSFINLRMGPFHACCIFLAVIGKRFGSAGLKDMIVEASLTGPGSVDAILRGKHYNRGLRVMKVIYESLHRLKLESFENWMKEMGTYDVFADLFESQELEDLVQARTYSNLQEVLQVSSTLQQYYLKFEENIENNTYGPMAKFWQSFLEMVQILLDYIKSTRMGDWDLHLCSMERMLPWFHAYDRINYARHFTYCWATLKELPETKPEIHFEFEKGNFSVQRTKGKFNRLPPDQVIEQTINKEQKGPGGIIGISTSVGSVQRWVFTSHLVAEINSDFKQSIDVDQSSETKDLGKARKIYDEKMVKDCCEVIRRWKNPFNQSSELVALTSGVEATKELVDNLEGAKDIGQKKVKRFIGERIKTNEIAFNDPIKKEKLLTFDDIKAKPISKSKGLTLALRSEREMFARLALVQRHRDISIKDILQYELTSLPLSLANPDGSLAKTIKSKLFSCLTEYVQRVDEAPENTANIFDGMVLFQKLPPTLTTFGEIADYLIEKITRGNCRVAFFVTDYYKENSIKSLERKRRSAIGCLRIKINDRNQRKPKSWANYLQHPKNKLELVRFLISDWSRNERNIVKLHNKELYVTCESDAYCIRANQLNLEITDVQELKSFQEEADTKMFLCAQYASNLDYPSVKIVTVDTDVAVLSLYFSSKINANIYLDIGTGLKRSIYDISNHQLSPEICDALPGLHALTGCDSTSSFNGLGKAKCFNVMKTDEEWLAAFAVLGATLQMSSSVIESLETYVCHIYGEKQSKVLDDARYMVFSGKKKFPDPHKLPPTSDAFKLHLKRSNYQAHEWRQALICDRTLTNPEGHGWCISTDGNLDIQWLSQPPAPSSLLELMSCRCKKTKCSNNSCGCKKENLACTDLCKCVECNNNKKEEFYESDYFEESDDSEDE